MKKKYLLFIYFFLFKSLISIAQEITIYGTIADKTGFVENANIINRQTNKGTFSDINGRFSIDVSLNQKIEITSIQHHPRIIRIDTTMFLNKTLTIQMRLKENLLDEVTVSNKKMFGIYKRDFKQNIRAIAIVKSVNALNFKKIKISANENYNKTNTMNRLLGNITDPTQRFEGIKLGVSIISFKESKKQIAKKRFEYKEKFPSLLLETLGQRFFLTELHIPEENYHHFLQYCSIFEIERLYKEGKTLEIIEIFNKEAEIYLHEMNLK